MIGVDMGGTTITAGRFTNNQLEKKVVYPTEAFRGRGEIVLTLIDSIDQVWNADCKALGIGVPGFIDLKNGVITRISNIPAFNGIPLVNIIADHFKVPVYMNNDANCFVLGEKIFGAGKNKQNIVGLSLGTGLGAGLFISGQLVTGTSGGAGELGQIAYLDKTYEDYCSGKFFQSQFNCDGSLLYEKAESGNEKALDAFNQFGFHLAQLIKLIYYFIDPELIVIGGSVSNSFNLFKPALINTLQTDLGKSTIDSLEIVSSGLTDGALFGAAALTLQ